MIVQPLSATEFIFKEFNHSKNNLLHNVFKQKFLFYVTGLHNSLILLIIILKYKMFQRLFLLIIYNKINIHYYYFFKISSNDWRPRLLLIFKFFITRKCVLFKKELPAVQESVE